MTLKQASKRRGFLVAAGFAAAFAVALAVKGPTPVVSQGSAGAPRLIAASFTSAFCPACRILAPRLAAVMGDFKGEPVEFVEFDFTFGETQALAARAAALGLERLYEANKGATGFTVLVDARSGAVVDTLTMNFAERDISRAIRNALAITSYAEDGAGPAPAPGP
ncbi:MAG: hypothetical protein ACK4NP_06235 [Parvularculaceae bacterium]